MTRSSARGNASRKKPSAKKSEQADSLKSGSKDIAVQKATGLTDSGLSPDIIDTILVSLPGIEHASIAERRKKLEKVIALLDQIGPRQAMEGMLAGQMIACHEHALECFRKSQSGQFSQNAQLEYLKQGMRLLEIFRKQLQTIARYQEGRAVEDHAIMLEQQRYEEEKKAEEERKRFGGFKEHAAYLVFAKAAKEHGGKTD